MRNKATSPVLPALLLAVAFIIMAIILYILSSQISGTGGEAVSIFDALKRKWF